MEHYLGAVRARETTTHNGWVVVGLAAASWLGLMALTQVVFAAFGGGAV